MPSVLFVLTSADKTVTGKPAGWYLPEAAHPYYLINPHYNVEFASPKGGDAPIDKSSIDAFSNDEESVKFLKDPVVKSKIEHTKKLSEVNVDEYDAIFYVGGHGPVMDLPTDPDNIKLVSQFWTSGKIVSAVCHGPAALVGGVDGSGKSISAGKNTTGFSNEEESLFGTVEEVPFSLEDKIVELGGNFLKSDKAYGVKVVVDGRLVTGANPASAGPVAEALLKVLQSRD
ncbi:class I glutamine amidotransferase-like protein [Agrocybe pediades]|nr:class I glutamine amidotransferase-like protein [Agrocybe pediades]